MDFLERVKRGWVLKSRFSSETNQYEDLASLSVLYYTLLKEMLGVAINGKDKSEKFWFLDFLLWT